MKVLGIIGSPRKNGNTATMVNAILKGAIASGHEGEIINLTELNIHDCSACCTCKMGKVGYCVINDDMQKLYELIKSADCLVFGTPIYMGQMTGQMKNFFDRWYTFLDENYQIHHVQGKKYITVTASGAPAEAFRSVSDYLNYWLGDFFKMQLVDNIIGGGLGPADAINNQPELLAMAENVGLTLK